MSSLCAREAPCNGRLEKIVSVPPLRAALESDESPHAAKAQAERAVPARPTTARVERMRLLVRRRKRWREGTPPPLRAVGLISFRSSKRNFDEPHPAALLPDLGAARLFFGRRGGAPSHAAWRERSGPPSGSRA